MIVVIPFLFLVISCDQLGVGIRTGENLFIKSLFFGGAFPGGIRTIQVGNFNLSADKEVIILSQQNCFILDMKTRKQRQEIKFNQRIGLRPEVLNIGKDGSVEIMLRGGGFGDVGLVNTHGEFIWKYKSTGTGPSMTGGDLDRDGKIEFYVAEHDGLHKIDYSGKEIWKVDNYLDQVSVYDPGDRGIPLIITRGYDGKLRFRDSSGSLVKEVVPEMETYDLEIVRWPDNYNILTRNGNRIIVIDFNGKLVFQHELEKEWFTRFPFFRSSFVIFDIRGVSVKLDVNKKPYLAVITKFRSGVAKAMLNIFSHEGKLVYQELLNTTTGLSAIETDDGSESLLVGDGTENVWIYKMKK